MPRIKSNGNLHSSFQTSVGIVSRSGCFLCFRCVEGRFNFLFGYWTPVLGVDSLYHFLPLRFPHSWKEGSKQCLRFVRVACVFAFVRYSGSRVPVPWMTQLFTGFLPLLHRQGSVANVLLLLVLCFLPTPVSCIALLDQVRESLRRLCPSVHSYVGIAFVLGSFLFAVL